MKLALGADHGGYRLKEEIKKYLEELNVEYTDYGTNNTESVDYPEYGVKVAEAVAKGKEDKGILFCTTGVGMSVVANKVPGIRAACCLDPVMAEYSRSHNDTNVLVLAGKFTDSEKVKGIVKKWLDTPFSEEERHVRRISAIKEVEKKHAGRERSREV